MRDTVKTSTLKARRLRHDMPYAERVLWQSLRARRLDGFRFRRQHPVGAFILDFACLSARLAVEIDGPSHDTPKARQHDIVRDRILRQAGWRVIRFRNVEVLDDLDRVVREIHRHLPPQSGCRPPAPPQSRGAS
ncbi:endonuclease domain-containing protein [Maricaulis sp. CAU 1757]